MSENFADLMGKALDEVEAPQPMPVGTYGLTIINTETGESSQKKTPFIQVNFQTISIGDDIDGDMIEAAGGEEKIIGKKLNEKFYVTEEALFRFKDFLMSCGFDTDGKSFADLIPDLPGAEVQAYVTQTPNKDGTRFFNNIASFGQPAD